MLKKNCVGAGPSAPDSAKHGGDAEEAESKSRDEKEEHPQILRGERETKEMKAPVQCIQEYGGEAVHGNPRERDVDDEEQRSDDAPPFREAAGDIGRVQDSL
jgi:hypothetical protein